MYHNDKACQTNNIAMWQHYEKKLHVLDDMLAITYTDINTAVF